jgi:carbon starvation protein
MVNKEFIDILITKGPVPAFSLGVARFINAIPVLNISIPMAQTFTALAVSAFALTSLDTATRLARFMFQEYFENKENEKKSVFITNRYVSTAITVAFGAALTFSGQTMSIWPVFGSANQLLAALALLALTVWVANLKKGYLFVLVPMIFMFAVTLTALAMLIYTNFIIANYTLAVISILLFTLAILLGIKAYGVLGNGNQLIKETI